LPYVEAFIRAIHGSLAVESPDRLTGLLISRHDRGSLIIDGADLRAYKATVEQLMAQFVKKDDLSRRSTEAYLDDALFLALDVDATSTATFEERVKESLETLYKEMTSSASRFRCLVRVEGIAAEDLPVALGRVRFVKYGPTQERQLVGQEGNRSDRGRVLRDARANLVGRVFATVDVEARDFESARVLARREARTVIDLVNFFCDLTPYNHGWLHLASEAIAVTDVMPARESDGTLHLGHQTQGPLLPFSLKELRKAKPTLRRLQAVSKLHRVSRSKSAGEILLTGLQWAGRASVDPRREQSFLLFAIAVEAAVLPVHHPEQTYRLSTRMAGLLGANRRRRAEIRQSVTQLYDVRSSIVHSGSYEVSDADLGQLRSLAKATLLRLVDQRRLWNMTVKELDEWLQARADR
jgi:hypothetical protein